MCTGSHSSFWRERVTLQHCYQKTQLTEGEMNTHWVDSKKKLCTNLERVHVTLQFVITVGDNKLQSGAAQLQLHCDHQFPAAIHILLRGG